MEQDISITIRCVDESQFERLRNAFDIFAFPIKEDYLKLGVLTKIEAMEKFWEFIDVNSLIDPSDYPEIAGGFHLDMFDIQSDGVTLFLDFLSGDYMGEEIAQSIARLGKSLGVSDVEFESGDYV